MASVLEDLTYWAVEVEVEVVGRVSTGNMTETQAYSAVGRHSAALAMGEACRELGKRVEEREEGMETAFGAEGRRSQVLEL